MNKLKSLPLILLLLAGFLFFNSPAQAIGDCPDFKGTDPAMGTDSTGKPTHLLFTPVSGKRAFSYFVSTVAQPTAANVGTLNEDSSGDWLLSLGNAKAGSYTYYLFFNSDSRVANAKSCSSFSFTVTRSDSGSTTNPGFGIKPTENTASGVAYYDNKSVNTAFGKISTDPVELTNLILKIAFGVAGGVSFLLIVYGGFKLALSQGNPENIQSGREMITSAIIGLLIIIFSTFLLRLIGVDILGLPI